MKIKLHYSILLVFILCLFTRLFLEFIIFFLIISLHELGHITMALIFKQNIRSITLTALGGIVEIGFVKINTLKQLLINSSGVIFNGILLLTFNIIPPNPWHMIIINYNLLLIIFNLMPIYPLDGYRIFTNIISLFCKPIRQYQIILIISVCFLSLLTFYSLVNFSVAFIIVSGFLWQKNIYLILNKNYYLLQQILYRL